MIDRYKGDKQMEHIKSTKSKPKDPHSPNKEKESDRLKKTKQGDKYPDYKPKPKDEGIGGSKVVKKPDPKKPMSPAAKRLKRTASRPK
jgi:hypothetical protein